MKIFKFTKTSTSSLAAHVDTIRAMTYILRRAGVDVEYSQGFNPHIELGFSPPLSLGVESFSEYVAVKTDEQNMLLDRLNAVCPNGITFLREWTCRVNLAATINSALYRVQTKGIGEVVEQITAPNYTISYIERGEVVYKDVSSRILYAKRIDANTAEICLSIGNENLRPDRIVKHLLQQIGSDDDYSIIKLQAFVNGVDVDTYLDNLQAAQLEVTTDTVPIKA